MDWVLITFVRPCLLSSIDSVISVTTSGKTSATLVEVRTFCYAAKCRNSMKELCTTLLTLSLHTLLSATFCRSRIDTMRTWLLTRKVIWFTLISDSCSLMHQVKVYALRQLRSSWLLSLYAFLEVHTVMASQDSVTVWSRDLKHSKNILPRSSYWFRWLRTHSKTFHVSTVEQRWLLMSWKTGSILKGQTPKCREQTVKSTLTSWSTRVKATGGHRCMMAISIAGKASTDMSLFTQDILYQLFNLIYLTYLT